MAGTQVWNVTFGDDMISTTVTSSGEAVEDWIEEVKSVHSRRLHKLVVGLDIEWRPTFSTDYSTTALLQLCVGRRCLVFQLIHADYIPDALDEFLGNSDYRFVGVGVKGDADRLWNDWELEVVNSVDLAELVADELYRPDLRNAGLKSIAAAVMGANMEKPYWVTTGPWDARSLSHEQIRYACIDSFVSFEVGRRLLSGEY
jgi:ribonuclease D